MWCKREYEMMKHAWELTVVTRGKTHVFSFDSKGEIDDIIGVVTTWSVWTNANWIRVKDYWLRCSEIDMIGWRKII